MIKDHSNSVLDVIQKLFAVGPSSQIAISIENLAFRLKSPRDETCSLLEKMRSTGQIELSIWHPVASPETDLAGYPHCVPFGQWREWEPHEFFMFGVHDQGRIRINIL